MIKNVVIRVMRNDEIIYEDTIDCDLKNFFSFISNYNVIISETNTDFDSAFNISINLTYKDNLHNSFIYDI